MRVMERRVRNQTNVKVRLGDGWLWLSQPSPLWRHLTSFRSTSPSFVVVVSTPASR